MTSGEIVGYYLDGRADHIGADDQTYYEHGFYSTLSNGVRQYTSMEDPDARRPGRGGFWAGPQSSLRCQQ